MAMLLKSLPDFLVFPAFLALVPRDRFTSTSPEVPDREIIRAMNLFIAFVNEAQERSQSSSDALKFSEIITSFAGSNGSGVWTLEGLQSCLDILSEGQKLAKVIPLLQFEPSMHSLMNDCQPSVPIPGTQQRKLRSTVLVGTPRKRTSYEFPVNSNNALESDTSNSPSKRRK
ncbi:hypothetical protein BDR03DRAFT_974127 [Suillus americanus]|nr:hypothetical protein BDR03DRAFT_974127 [Suillus americanus]